MKLAAFVAVALLAAPLAACDLTATNQKISDTAAADLPTICALAASAHASFATAAATGTLKPDLVAKEATAFDVLNGICNSPPKDIAGVMTSVANSYAIIVAANAAAKA
jgi:hypothetical protein